MKDKECRGEGREGRKKEVRKEGGGKEGPL